MNSGITLMGFYRYNQHLFDGFEFPPDTFRKDLFTGCLIRRWGMQCPYIQAYEELEEQIGMWSLEQAENFKMLYDAFTAEYNPIHNYDRTEDLRETPDITTAHTGDDVTELSGNDKVELSGTDKISGSGTDKVELSGSDKQELSGSDELKYSGADTHKKEGTQGIQYSGNFTDTHSERAYNSGVMTQTYSDRNDRSAGDTTTYDLTDTDDLGHSETTTYGKGDTTTYGKIDTTTYGKTDTTTYGKVDTTTYGKKDTLTHGHTITETGNRVHHNHIYGNIGVTTTAQMLEQELMMRKDFNPYQYISDLFADEFLSKVL